MLELFWRRGTPSQATRESTTYLFNGFKFLGLNSTQKWKTLYYIYSAIINLSVAVFMLLTFSLSFFLLSGQMTTSQLLSSLQVAINVCGLPSKVITIKWFMKHLREAEDIMDTLDGRCQLEDEYRKIRHCIKSCNRLAIFFASFYGLSCVLTFLSSVYMGQPPYSLYMIPLDWRNSNWEFMVQSSVEFLLMTYICFHQSMSDCYAVIYIYIMRIHMQILVERVKRLGTVDTKGKYMNYLELIECIKDHQNLLRLHNKVSPVISVTIFAQFTITAIILCTIMINIVLFADTSAQISSVSYFFCVLIQTSPCCYQATCLLEDSEQLPLAILKCNWMEEDKHFRKMLIFFIQRSQRPMKLTALKLFPITLDTNISIAKFSFSLYTLIQTFNLGHNGKT